MSAHDGHPTTGNLRSRRRPLSVPVKLLVTAITMMVGLIGTASVASAWHADVTAQSDCRGTISYQATAWDRATANPQIEIAYSSQGAAGPWKTVTVGAFNQANTFSFGGSFAPTPNSPGTTITVRAQALAPWVGQTAVDRSPRTVDVLLPAPCVVPVSVPVSVKLPCPTSIVYGRTTTFTAAAQDGVAPYTYQWTLNGKATGTASATLTAVLNSSSDLVSVKVTDSRGNSATARASCQGMHQAPMVSMSCPASFTYGQPATWTATATRAVPADTLSYRWTLDGAGVGSDSPSVTTTLKSTKNVLTITVTEAFGDGKASASSATQTCIAHVVVLIPPIQIVHTPVVPAKAVTIKAAAEVTPASTLPFTGSHVPEQVALGMGLLAAGLILLRVSGHRAAPLS